MRQRLAERVVDQEGDRTTDGDEHAGRHERPAAAHPQACADERNRGGDGEQGGLEDEPELRHAEVELALEGREPDEEPAHQRGATDAHGKRRVRPPRVSGSGLHALGKQNGLADQGHPGAPDHHQVRRSPERHVLAEEAVPDVVEREPEQAEGTTDGDEDAAHWCVPLLADAQRRGTGPVSLLRQAHREGPGAEDPEQPDEDQVVGWVCERPWIAAGVDVERDVPVHPGERDEQRSCRDERWKGGPRRQADGPCGAVRRLPQIGEAAGPVAVAEGADRGEAGQTHAGCDGDLVEGGAARGLVMREWKK